MLLRRKVGIAIAFSCMPAMAPLWAMLFEQVGIWPVAWGTAAMIRALTPIFVIGVLLALAGSEGTEVTGRDAAEEE